MKRILVLILTACGVSNVHMDARVPAKGSVSSGNAGGSTEVLGDGGGATGGNASGSGGSGEALPPPTGPLAGGDGNAAGGTASAGGSGTEGVGGGTAGGGG